MEGYSEQTYGDTVAGVYDEWFGVAPALEAAADFLAGLAGTEGRALELGIGTGRIALPLAARGVRVHGIDASEEMVARLRAKPGGDQIPVDIGDFSDVAADGEFDLVYVVVNTFFCLTSQEAQLRCLAQAAARLKPGGHVVIEAFVPDMTRFDHRQRVDVRSIDVGHVRLDATQHDPVAQTLTSQQVVIGADGIRLYPVFIRYAWPTELDLMARLAGLELSGRYGGWRREAFTAASGVHVSVYRSAS
jgi:SAM-dependent methyltransferase